MLSVVFVCKDWARNKNLSREEKFKKFDLRRYDRLKSIWQKNLIIFEIIWQKIRSRTMIRFERDKAKTDSKTKQSKRMWNDYYEFQKNRLRRFEVKTIITFLLFYRVQITWKITIDYFSHVLTKERNNVWIKKKIYIYILWIITFCDNHIL